MELFKYGIGNKIILFINNWFDNLKEKNKLITIFIFFGSITPLLLSGKLNHIIIYYILINLFLFIRIYGFYLKK